MRTLRPVAVAGFLIVGLAAPVATVAALAGSTPAIAAAVAAWVALLVYWYRAPWIWTDVDTQRARAAVLGGEVVAVVALVLGFFANYAISVDHGLCGGGATPIAALGLAALVYVAVGGVALRRAGRLLWLWPLLVLGLWGISLVARILLPGGHGFCET
jgi:hypothetical protein